MRWTTLAWFGVVFAALGGGAEELTVERLVGSPDLDGETAKQLKVSPDGQRVTFLQGKATDKERLDLWEITVADGERSLLVDSAVLEPREVELDEVEKARRERQRIRSRGIVEYEFSDDGKVLLFPLGGDLYVLTLGGTPRRLTTTEATETDARFSPDGRFVSFVRHQNLHLVDVATGQERALTTEGGGLVSWAMAEFVAQEEMDRVTGYWWSPDSRRIALTRIDEEPVALINRYEIGSGGVVTIPQRYPFAGSTNARVEIHALDLEKSKLQKMDLGTNEDIYVARVDWHPDGRTLAVQRQSRDQKSLDLGALGLSPCLPLRRRRRAGAPAHRRGLAHRPVFEAWGRVEGS